jgi:hypothetical protein
MKVSQSISMTAELSDRAKDAAAERRMTLSAFVTSILERELSVGTKAAPASGSITVSSETVFRPVPKPGSKR